MKHIWSCGLVYYVQMLQLLLYFFSNEVCCWLILIVGSVDINNIHDKFQSYGAVAPHDSKLMNFQQIICNQIAELFNVSSLLITMSALLFI